MVKVSVVGASSFAGGEIVRLLLNHEEAELALLVGGTHENQKIQEVFPYLKGFIDQSIVKLDIERLAEESDLAFLILPHGQAMEVAEAMFRAGKKVIDMGAAFRFRNAQIYEVWYKEEHLYHGLAQDAVYGLPEIHREKLRKAAIVGNPGCYPTASILALYPLLQEKWSVSDSLIIDAKSGVSGAGRTPGPGNIFAECNESVKAYNIGKHRHTPEIEQELSQIAKEPLLINFTPHLIPMTRGILATAYVRLQPWVAGREVWQLYQRYYEKEYFVKVHPEGVYPQTKWAAGTNFCHIGLAYDDRTHRVIVTSAIDNLGKGAAGQAIQNLNLMFDLPENMGLKILPQCP